MGNHDKTLAVIRALEDSHNGNPHARAELSDGLYAELHAIAERFMRNERPDHTLQPTAVVHEAWLKLADQHNVDPQLRGHYLAAAANTIRRILVDHARTRGRAKRGGTDRQQIPLHTVSLDVANTDAESALDVLALHEALEALAELDSRQASVVELRYFGGLTEQETADQLGVSLRTVNNDWKFARAWLLRALSAEESDGGS